MCDLLTASVCVGSRLSKDYRYGHPRRAGASDLTAGSADVDGTGAGYGLRSSCGVGYTERV